MKSYIPDYPRPQFVRESWQNLNGIWNFAFDESGKAGRARGSGSDKIHSGAYFSGKKNS